MVSVLRTLQAEWNALVPQAQALNIRRVRRLNDPLETIAYRTEKLNWLRAEIERLTASSSLTPVAAVDINAFTFGCELECIMPVGMNHMRLAALITAAGVTCYSEGYNHNTHGHWKVVTDGSLGDYSRGAEVVSPVLRGDAGLDALSRVCNVLKDNGVKVNKRCGYHVHVGAREWQVDTFRNLCLLYAGSERFIDSFMAPSRRGAQGGNGFCRSLRVNHTAMASARTVDDVARACSQNPGTRYVRDSGRYCKLNLQSFWQHGTVEFRHHQGTVEAEKAVNWVRMCLHMCAAAMQQTAAIASMDALFDHVKATPTMANYFKARAEYFTAQEARAMRRAAAPFRRTA